MNTIERIKNWLYNNSLKKLAIIKRTVSNMNLIRAKRIGILFDATDVDERKAVVRYAESLRKKGKKVKLLGYISLANEGAVFDFDFFTKKDIDWAQRVKNDKTKIFLSHSYDLFICIPFENTKSAEYISLQTKAEMRIGAVAEHPACYDLMIDCPKGTTPLQFIKQYEAILELTMEKELA